MDAPGEIATRLATAADAGAIAAIYNEGMADGIATFETEPRTPARIAAQLAAKGDRFPTVVAEREGRVIAWASAGPYRDRPAYAGVAEHSVYVARRAEPAPAAPPSRRSVARTPSAASGRSSPASFPKTRRASRCTSAAASASSASTGVTASSATNSATA